MNQRGFITLTISLLLLTILLAVSLLVVKSMLADRRISLNAIHYRQAQALLDSALSDGMGRVAAMMPLANWQGQQSSNVGEYRLAIEVLPTVTIASRELRPMKIRASVQTDELTAQLHRQIVVLRYPLLTRLPPAPLLLAHGMGTLGDFTLMTNEQGRGANAPWSVWSGGAVDMQLGRRQSCLADETGKNCGIYLSQGGDKQADIQDSDSQFPQDLLWYLFNEPDSAQGWLRLRSQALAELNDCQGLDSQSHGLIIINGDCELNQPVGSVSAPLLLIVRNGAVQLTGNGVLYGLLLSHHSEPQAAEKDIRMTGNAMIHGALIANHLLAQSNALVVVRFDGVVLTRLQQAAALQVSQYLAGSRQDE